MCVGVGVGVGVGYVEHGMRLQWIARGAQERWWIW